MFIQTEITPNPQTLKFVPGRVVMPKGTVHLPNKKAAEKSPFARRLFDIDGVAGVFFGSDFITIAKDQSVEWDILKPLVLGSIMDHYSSEEEIIVKSDEENNKKVTSDNDTEVIKQIKELFNTKNIEIFEVSYKNSGINLEVDNPSEVGADRICNVSAANKIYGSPSIIIDFGTATTYDITNDEGNFIGGAIAPGIDVSADNLISKASLLKDTVYQFPKSIIGKNTTSNIQSGVMFSGLHSVRGMIKQIKDEMKSLSPNVILTGGFGKLISEALDVEHIYNESLTIEGMLNIYNKSN